MAAKHVVGLGQLPSGADLEVDQAGLGAGDGVAAQHLVLADGEVLSQQVLHAAVELA